MRIFLSQKGKAIHFEMPIRADGHFTLQNTWVYFLLFCDTPWISWEKNDFYFIYYTVQYRQIVACNK